ncbi:MAG: hypothetical protein ACRDLU_02725 [Gaiellaceae bacterium]
MKLVAAAASIGVLAPAGGATRATVTAARLTVRLKDARGRPVRDVLGTPCAPVVIGRQ